MWTYKYLQLIIFLVCIQPACFAGQVISSHSSDYDMTGFTLFYGFEAADFSGTNGTTDYSAGDDTLSLSGGAAINSDAGLYGTNGLDIPTSADYGSLDPTGIIPADLDFIIAFSIRINTAWASAYTPLFILKDTADNDMIDVFMDGTSGEISFRYDDAGAGGGRCDVTGLAVDTVYFILAIVDKTGDDLHLKIYNSSLTLQGSDSDLNTSLGTTEGWDYMRYGNEAGQSVDMHFDQGRINEDLADEADVLNTMTCTNYSGC